MPNLLESKCFNDLHSISLMAEAEIELIQVFVFGFKKGSFGMAQLFTTPSNSNRKS